MNEPSYEKICDNASYLNLDLSAQDLAQFILDHQFDDSQIEAIRSLLEHLAESKRENIVSTLLKMSRLPLKEPKTFENFDYDCILRSSVAISAFVSSQPALPVAGYNC